MGWGTISGNEIKGAGKKPIAEEALYITERRGEALILILCSWYHVS
jgi:hypothetical protein